MKPIIGIIGYGNMGQAIASQLKNNYQIYCFDKDFRRTAGLDRIKSAASIMELVNKADCIILAVKPQDFAELLNQLKEYKLIDKLIISIAAGITTEYVEKILGLVRLIRAMPNLPLKIGEGMACLCKGRFASEEDFNFAEELFDYMGETLRIKEGLMNAATAVSGSGPAYVCNFLETGALDAGNIPEEEARRFLNDFRQAASSLGFSRQESELLARVTFNGTIAFLKQGGILPPELKRQVASKGGTTEAALKVLENKGTLKEAVLAAVKRAEELSKKE